MFVYFDIPTVQISCWKWLVNLNSEECLCVVSSYNSRSRKLRFWFGVQKWKFHVQCSIIKILIKLFWLYVAISEELSKSTNFNLIVGKPSLIICLVNMPRDDTFSNPLKSLYLWCFDFLCHFAVNIWTSTSPQLPTMSQALDQLLQFIDNPFYQLGMAARQIVTGTDFTLSLYPVSAVISFIAVVAAAPFFSKLIFISSI